MFALTLQPSQPISSETMETDNRTLNIWIVEDSKLYRNKVEQVLNATNDLRLTGDFLNCEALLRKHNFFSDTDRPDVIVLDVHLSRDGKRKVMTGIEGIAKIKKAMPGIPIVMLTGEDDTDFVFRAFRQGASGYLNKSAKATDIQDAIRMAHRGGMIFPPAVAAKVMILFQGTNAGSDEELTKREMEIVELMANGRIRREIATDLFISPNTVDSHLNKIYQKLHVSTGTEAVAKVYKGRSPLEPD